MILLMVKWSGTGFPSLENHLLSIFYIIFSVMWWKKHMFPKMWKMEEWSQNSTLLFSTLHSNLTQYLTLLTTQFSDLSKRRIISTSTSVYEDEKTKVLHIVDLTGHSGADWRQRPLQFHLQNGTRNSKYLRR